MEYKHSGLGIASFILSILAGLGIFILVVIAGMMHAAKPGGIDEKSPEAIALGLFIIGSIGLDLLALVLGICTFIQADRKKIFGILGFAFSAVTLVGLACLMAIGMASTMPN